MKMKSVLVFTCLSILSCHLQAQRIDRYEGSRIFWDIGSQTTVFAAGGYGRIIELQDGRLMAVAESGGVKIAFSTNKGITWTGEKIIAPNHAKTSNSVPDLVQLANGTILICYNPRPREPYSEDRKFGIRVIRSTDYGETWGNEIFVYDAQHTFTEGCWEPAFLELPSGELQCYFANEASFPTSSEQNISMCRSFDQGLTWNEAEVVSFRSGRRDGMPVPLLLEDKEEIVLIIEDSGITYPRFRPVTVRTTISDNWASGYVNGSSSKRELAATGLVSSSIAGAPYIRRLPSGETIISYQGTEGRISNEFYDMFVMVGDNEARNFKAKSQPFNVPADKRCKWNSLAVIDSGVVLAVGSTNINSANTRVLTMRGIPRSKLMASYGSVTIDGQRSSNEKWTDSKAEQLIMGSVTKSRWTSDFMYDNDYLYFTALVVDRDIIADLPNPDGIRLLIDAADISTEKPQKGTFNILFQVDGSIVLKKGNNGTWNTETNTANIQYAVTAKSSYYLLEAAIPWSTLGLSNVSTKNRLAVAVERFDRSTNSYQIERIVDARTNSPYTWMELQLLSNLTSTNELKSDEQIQTFIIDNQLRVVSPESISGVKIYSLDGRLVFSKSKIDNTEINLSLIHINNANICSIQLTNGQIINKKLFF